jgi:hypothetical protein
MTTPAIPSKTAISRRVPSAPTAPHRVHDQAHGTTEASQLVGQRLLAKQRHAVGGRDLREALGIADGRDHALGACQSRELDDGRAQRAGGAQHQDVLKYRNLVKNAGPNPRGIRHRVPPSPSPRPSDGSGRLPLRSGRR